YTGLSGNMSGGAGSIGYNSKWGLAVSDSLMGTRIWSHTELRNFGLGQNRQPCRPKFRYCSRSIGGNPARQVIRASGSWHSLCDKEIGNDHWHSVHCVLIFACIIVFSNSSLILSVDIGVGVLSSIQVCLE